VIIGTAPPRIHALLATTGRSPGTVIPGIGTVIPVIRTVIPGIGTVIPVIGTVIPGICTVIPIIRTVLPVCRTVYVSFGGLLMSLKADDRPDSKPLESAGRRP
jgi:hypothetical protein